MKSKLLKMIAGAALGLVPVCALTSCGVDEHRVSTEYCYIHCAADNKDYKITNYTWNDYGKVLKCDVDGYTCVFTSSTYIYLRDNYCPLCKKNYN